MTVTDALLGPLLDARGGADPARPLLTHYDDATGERIELSGLTTANWVAKTANLLRDECDVDPGSTVALLLPAHWQTACALLAAWWCGARVVAGPDGADVALCDASTVSEGTAAGLVVGFSLDAFGRGLDELPSDAVDYATEVRVHGDHFAPPGGVGGDAPALGSLPVDDVVAAARNRAVELGLAPTDRVLSTLDWPLTLDDPASGGGLVDGLLAVLAAGASLVHVRHADPERLDRKAGSERVTRRV